ncbi:MAG: hypothetical protein JWP22_1667 [Ramlibacter sp.]|nr:hypothetical protein [Ramlibacter sp.]MDB5912992.1 hypothetical protein [Ramlibacter sp.]
MAIDAAIAWRALSFLMLGWLALFFGRTLRPGQEALITRIARVSEPALPADLVRYTRRLTAIWAAYFVLAAVIGLAAAPSPWTGLLVWAGTAALFLGEHWLRPLLFPGHCFPGLRQQVKDTLHVWRPVRQNGD